VSNRYQKHKVNFCPFCGSPVVTHIENSVFMCGCEDPNIEAEEKVCMKNTRCNRVFSVIMPKQVYSTMSTTHRKRIGEIVKLHTQEEYHEREGDRKKWADDAEKRSVTFLTSLRNQRGDL